MELLRRFFPGSKERYSGADIGIPEAVVRGKRALYVPAFGINHRPEVIDEFRTNGYSIVGTLIAQDDPFPGKEQDLGLFLVRENLSYGFRKSESIAKLAEIEQPREYQHSEILTLPKPFVVKFPTSDRGESVFLLDGRESIDKFLVYANEHFTSSFSRDQKKEKMEAAKHAIESEQWDWEGFSEMEVSDSWIFQEYIETPSDYYASFRILADGYGNIHYGTLLRSPQPKGVRKVVDRTPNPIDHSFTYLHNPNSISCLDAPDIVSNAAQGGIPIQLNGVRIEHEANRDVASAHNIDPDNPHIPEQLKDKASKVGILMKRVFPFTGVDFIYDRDLKDFFLEANTGPSLFAEGLGVSHEEIRKNKRKEHEQEYLTRVLIRRIAKTDFPRLAL